MWYRIPAYEALWPLLDQINAEMDAKMEQVSPTHPGASDVCARCLDLQASYERAVIANGELEEACEKMRDERDTAHKTIAEHEQTIMELSQQLRDQENEHLRMDRRYRADGFTGMGQ